MVDQVVADQVVVDFVVVDQIGAALTDAVDVAAGAVGLCQLQLTVSSGSLPSLLTHSDGFLLSAQAQSRPSVTDSPIAASFLTR